MKTYEVNYRVQGVEAWQLVERPEPVLQPGQVLVKMRAASLNYRDLAIVNGTYGAQPRVPLSDGAGEVAATAEGVTRWKAGDRVAGIFFQTFLAGAFTPERAAHSLGGGVDGVLAEYVAFDQEGLVEVPAHLSYEEAATLPCAGVTAWNALVVEGPLRAGQTVLLLGTGGVSVFALQFAKQAGARVILTSSSDEKLRKAREHGADETINYKTTPEWDERVLELTGGRGVDDVVELGGAETLARSLRSVGHGGSVKIVGVINGTNGEIDITSILSKRARVQGISVGSRESFEEMNRAIVQGKLRPVIDRVFPFAEAKQALAYLESGAHFGKVCITF